MESKLAADYGIMVLPNLFLVGKDGKVVTATCRSTPWRMRSRSSCRSDARPY